MIEIFNMISPNLIAAAQHIMITERQTDDKDELREDITNSIYQVLINTYQCDPYEIENHSWENN